MEVKGKTQRTKILFTVITRVSTIQSGLTVNWFWKTPHFYFNGQLTSKEKRVWKNLDPKKSHTGCHQINHNIMSHFSVYMVIVMN